MEPLPATLRAFVPGLRHWRDSLNVRITAKMAELDRAPWWRERRLRRELRFLIEERNRIAFRISGFVSIAGDPRRHGGTV